MTDRKISELTAVTTVEDADEFVVARSGVSNKITGANLKAAGGGSQPVTCVLEAQPDVHDALPAPFDWSDLYNNPLDFTHLLAIPDGLGLAFSFDGTDNTITTTAAGTWAFTLGFFVTTDDTWRGLVTLDSGLYAQANITAALLGGAYVSLSETVTVPAGWSIAPSVSVAAAATADPFFCDCYLTIVRLA